MARFMQMCDLTRYILE